MSLAILAPYTTSPARNGTKSFPASSLSLGGQHNDAPERKKSSRSRRNCRKKKPTFSESPAEAPTLNSSTHAVLWSPKASRVLANAVKGSVPCAADTVTLPLCRESSYYADLHLSSQDELHQELPNLTDDISTVMVTNGHLEFMNGAVQYQDQLLRHTLDRSRRIESALQRSEAELNRLASMSAKRRDKAKRSLMQKTGKLRSHNEKLNAHSQSFLARIKALASADELENSLLATTQALEIELLVSFLVEADIPLSRSADGTFEPTVDGEFGFSDNDDEEDTEWHNASSLIMSDDDPLLREVEDDDDEEEEGEVEEQDQEDEDEDEDDVGMGVTDAQEGMEVGQQEEEEGEGEQVGGCEFVGTEECRRIVKLIYGIGAEPAQDMTPLHASDESEFESDDVSLDVSEEESDDDSDSIPQSPERPTKRVDLPGRRSGKKKRRRAIAPPCDLFDHRSSTGELAAQRRKLQTLLEEDPISQLRGKQHKPDTVDQIKQKILEGHYVPCKVEELEQRGKGVIIQQSVCSGQFICEYFGDLLTKQEAEAREESYADQVEGDEVHMECYMFYFAHCNKTYCIDATNVDYTLDDFRSFGRFINHSRTSGNLRPVRVSIDDKPRLCFVADRDIGMGEELTYDYGDQNADNMEAFPWLQY
eukprot:TRINITY_DN3199_c0_g1_i1.p1 TRINITY_DN3199_c0_g1~~TRINITY_DN3199_c0_g1_i1.p1  ORF type:complete len:649 (-),score=141.51 TRINITY_DN3199_c0_g1_i1:55-2001(-)